MSQFLLIAVVVLAISLTYPADSFARGGRGGGGGFSGGGMSRGGGHSWPSASRSPSMSRASTCNRTPSVTRPTQGQLHDFLNIPSSSSGTRPTTRPSSGIAAGGAAAAFVNHSSETQRPDRMASRQNGRVDGVGDRTDRTDRASDRLDERIDRINDRRDLASTQPTRYEDRQQRYDQRLSRRDEVRDQFQNNHPRYDFWKGNPNWAKYRWNHPYHWATWGLVTGWFPGVWTTPVTYSYGENIYYQDNNVYYGDEVVATSDEGKESPIMESGIENLTNDEAPALLHFDHGKTQQCLLVRIEDSEGQEATN